MPKCRSCQFEVENKTPIATRTKKGMVNPFCEYCEHPDMRHKLISKRALHKYGYPIWCPLGTYNYCLQCGTRIRIEEGEYCNKCK